MNRRQEIALWVVGLIIAFITFSEASGDLEDLWLPVCIIGLLLIFSLRTRSPESKAKNERDLKIGAGVILLLVVIGAAEERLSSLESQVYSAEMSAELSAGAVAEASRDIEQKLDHLESKLDVVESAVLFR